MNISEGKYVVCYSIFKDRECGPVRLITKVSKSRIYIDKPLFGNKLEYIDIKSIKYCFDTIEQAEGVVKIDKEYRDRLDKLRKEQEIAIKEYATTNSAII